MVRVQVVADLIQPRIDLDGVDMLGPLGERDGDVASVPRPDDQHVVQ